MTSYRAEVGGQAALPEASSRQPSQDRELTKVSGVWDNREGVPMPGGGWPPHTGLTGVMATGPDPARAIPLALEWAQQGQYTVAKPTPSLRAVVHKGEAQESWPPPAVPSEG